MSLLLRTVGLLVSLLAGNTLLIQLLPLTNLVAVVVRLSIVGQLNALLLARAGKLLLLTKCGVGIRRLNSWEGERLVQLLLLIVRY